MEPIGAKLPVASLPLPQALDRLHARYRREAEAYPALAEAERRPQFRKAFIKRYRKSKAASLGAIRVSRNGVKEQIFPSLSAFAELVRKYKALSKSRTPYTVLAFAGPTDPSALYFIPPGRERDVLRASLLEDGGSTLSELEKRGVLRRNPRNRALYVANRDAQVIAGDIRFRDGIIHILDAPAALAVLNVTAHLRNALQRAQARSLPCGHRATHACGACGLVAHCAHKSCQRDYWTSHAGVCTRMRELRGERAHPCNVDEIAAQLTALLGAHE